MMLTLFASMVLSTANAADPLARTVQGQTLNLEAPATLLVFWSLDCDCGFEIAALEDAGYDVVSVNTDAANASSQLSPFAARYGIDAPMVADADGLLRQRYSVDHGIVMVNHQGDVLARAAGAPSVAVAQLPALPEMVVALSD
jgi:hypothetical protein